MAFLCETHVWSSRDSIVVEDNELCCYSYHEKPKQQGDGVLQEYSSEKEKYVTMRGSIWALKNKRPERLCDLLHDLEEVLDSQVCVKVRWLSRTTFQMLLNTGLLVRVVVNKASADVEKIFIDRSLVNLTLSAQISDAIMTSDFFLFCYRDKLKVDYFTFGKKLPADSKTFEKLSAFDIKVNQIDTPGSLKGSAFWQLAFSGHQELILMWNRKSSHERTSVWSPMTTEREKANMTVFTVEGSNLLPLVFKRTDGELVNASFSSVHLDQLLAVEECVSPLGEVKALVCTYEFGRNRIDRIATTAIQLTAPVRGCEKSTSDEYLLLNCEDNTLVLFERDRKLLVTATSDVNLTHFVWHPRAITVIGSSLNGELQIFDFALNKISVILPSSETKRGSMKLGTVLKKAAIVDCVSWSVFHDSDAASDQCDDVLVMFRGGPMTLVRVYYGATMEGQLKALSLTHEYIKHGAVKQAVALLKMLNWNVEGGTCLSCLHAVLNHLFRLPLDPNSSGLIEAALATFVSAIKPLTEGIILQYREAIYSLTRRYFHHLLRHKQLEKAYLLAVDLGSADLFQDLYYVAVDVGEKLLGEVCLQQVDQLSGVSRDPATANCLSETLVDLDLSGGDNDLEDALNLQTSLLRSRSVNATPGKISMKALTRRSEVLDRQAAVLALPALRDDIVVNDASSGKQKKAVSQIGQLTVIKFGSV